MSGKKSFWLVVLLLFLMATAANSAPTICSCNRSVVDCAVSLSSDAHIAVVLEPSQITETCDSYLAAVAVAFLKPPAGLTDAAAPSAHVKSLPAVPGAFFMVLTGFLCVSLVKNRRVWLAALAGLLWAGQYGIRVLPQLAICFRHARQGQREFAPELTYPHWLETSHRVHSNIEGTQYVGLLHDLAGIPARKCAPTVTQWGEANASTSGQKVGGKVRSYSRRNIFSSPSAIIPSQYSLEPLLNCLAAVAGRHIRFSARFIFDSLARGPPEPA